MIFIGFFAYNIKNYFPTRGVCLVVLSEFDEEQPILVYCGSNSI